MKVVYLCHPVSGDIEANLRSARDWVRWAETYHDVAIVASWIIECEIWDDNNPTHRAAGLCRDLAVLERCDEVWLVGPRVSEGMQREANHGLDVGLEVYDYTGLAAPPLAPIRSPHIRTNRWRCLIRPGTE